MSSDATAGLSVDQVQKLTELGTPREIYEVGYWQIGKAMFGWSLLFLFAMGMLGAIAGYLAGYVPLTNKAGDLIFCIPLFSLFALLGASRAAQEWRNRKACVVLLSDGIARVAAGRLETCRWDQVSAVFQGLDVRASAAGLRTRHTLILQRLDGTILELDCNIDRLARFKELGQAVQRECTRLLLPAALSVLQSGEPQSFGPLSISHDGLHSADGTLPWGQVKEITVTWTGALAVVKKGSVLEWFYGPISEFQNLGVFLALCDQARKAPGEPPQS